MQGCTNAAEDRMSESGAGPIRNRFGRGCRRPFRADSESRLKPLLRAAPTSRSYAASSLPTTPRAI